MRYVALLRGINVGGKSKVSMPRLKGVFEDAGHGDVRTYINSGNVIFAAPRAPAAELARQLEERIAAELEVDVRVLVLPGATLARIAADLPREWANDSASKCDVMFLWPEHASATVIDRFATDAAREEIRYSHGAILWRVDRSHFNRSAIPKLVGTDLYRGMTIRNCNTVRKLSAMLSLK